MLYTRRQFIRRSLAGLSAAMAMGQVGCQRRRERIVVIGAGLSGLAAASRLKASGFNVVVLEAGSGLAGGSVRRDSGGGGATLDMGASWIHGITGNPLYDLARQIGADEDRSQVMEFWNTAPMGGHKTRVAFLVGDQARHANVWAEDAVTPLVLDDLRAMFGQGIPAPIEFARSEWHTDLFAPGSYPHLKPGSRLSDCGLLARSVDDRLFFAGDATDPQSMGTAHGACLSGLRAAGEVTRAAF